MNFSSCNSEDINEDSQLPKGYTVKLGCVGEILSYTQMPLVRSTEGKNYAYLVKVYIKDENILHATGTFDSFDNVLVNLQSNKRYIFKVTYEQYSDTFTPTNEFTYPSSSESPTMTYYSTQSYQHNDIYYGINNDYEPKENDNVNIYMKRMSFGIKIVAEELEKGESLKVKIQKDDGYNAGVISATLTKDLPSYEDIYSFADYQYSRVYEGILQNEELVNFSEKAEVSITLIKPNDTFEYSLGRHNITLERNKKTYVTIRVGERTTTLPTGITVTKEEAEMTDGIDYLIDGVTGDISEQ